MHEIHAFDFYLVCVSISCMQFMEIKLKTYQKGCKQCSNNQNVLRNMAIFTGKKIENSTERETLLLSKQISLILASGDWSLWCTLQVALTEIFD